MPWSDQNSNNDQQNPWGKKPGNNQQQPPDIDEVIRRLQERFSGFFGGGNNGGNGGNSFSAILILPILGVAFILWLASGIYSVAADERAVVLTFGAHTDTKGPGLNWHLPYPIETVEKIPVTRVQRIEIGFRGLPGGRIRKVSQESLMLTRDENIVDISFIVQFKIKDIGHYLFNVDNGSKTVRDAAESAIREVIGRTQIDDVLTTKKAEVEIETEQLIQTLLDSYQAGISVTTVKLQDVQPPERVIREFKDVASAREDRERAKNEAQAYANDVIPKARGESKKMILDAEAFRKAVTDHAKGESDRFSKMLTSYLTAPELTRKRLYLETIQEVMGKVDKVIVDQKVAGQVLPYLPLGKTGKVEVK
ncbi:MAG: FtsH protease activity modulator HflK [Mariprofundaceae bacterium]